MWLSDLWGDGQRARRVRLAVGALLVAAIAVDAPTPARGPFVVAVAVAALGWAAWALLPVDSHGGSAALLTICVASAVAVGTSGWADVVVLAFPFVVVAAAAERLPTRTAAAVAVVATISLLVAAGIEGEGIGYLVAVVVPWAGFGAGLAPRQHVKRVEQAELLLAESQRAREERERAAALAERVRVAREIHDLLAHSLTALAIELEIAQAQLVGRPDPDAALERVERSQRLVVEGIAETRRAVAALRGDSEPIRALLPRLIAEYGSESNTSATCTFEGEPRALPRDVDAICGRIAQEALTNVRKHAPGAAISATLSYEPAAMLMSIRNSRGNAPSRSRNGSGGYGVVGMRERAASVGGTVTAGAIDDQWQVELRLPA